MIDKVARIKASMVKGGINDLYPVYGVFTSKDVKELSSLFELGGVSEEVWRYYKDKVYLRLV